MSGVKIGSLACGFVVVVSAACASEAAVTQVSAQAESVRVEEGEPPPGAKLVGPLTATDGNGCGFGGDRGTLQGATALLRTAAMRRGVDFVRVTKVSKPFSGHDCYHQEFTLSGLGYRLAEAPRAPEPSASVSARVPAPAAPPPVVLGAASRAEACVPACSLGYACHAAVCEPECSPPCAAGEVCRADRVCVPGKLD